MGVSNWYAHIALFFIGGIMDEKVTCNQKECNCNDNGICIRKDNSTGNTGVCWMEKGQGEY